MVELLPKSAADIKTLNPLRGILIGTLIILIVILLAYCGMVGVQYYFQEQIQAVQNKIFALDKDLENYQETQQKMNALQEKITATETLYSQHIYWSPLFEKLERDTLPEISYLNFSATVEGTLSLQAEAPDYKSVSEQVAVLNAAKDWVLKASVDSASSSEQLLASSTPEQASQTANKVSFTLVLEVDPNIFYPQNNARSDNN